MKALIKIFLSLSIFSNVAFADCDFSKIQKIETSYLYSKELHVCVGEMKQDLEIEKQRTVKLSEAITFKDLALKKADERTELWMNTSFKLEDRVNKIDELRNRNQWLYFGLGIATVLATGYVLSELNRNR